MTEEEKKKIEEAASIILRGIDIESSALILEKAVMDNYIIVSGRVNILRVATRQILNFIEEYKNKGYLDVVREKVKANEKVTKLQKENEEKDKQIDELVKYIDSNNYVDNEECQFQWYFKIKKCIGNGDCKACIKQHIKKLTKEKGE